MCKFKFAFVAAFAFVCVENTFGSSCDLSNNEIRQLHLNSLPIWTFFQTSAERVLPDSTGRFVLAIEDTNYVIRDRLMGQVYEGEIRYGLRPQFSKTGVLLELRSDGEKLEFDVTDFKKVDRKRRPGAPKGLRVSIPRIHSEVIAFGFSENEEVLAFMTHRKRLYWKNLKSGELLKLKCERCGEFNPELYFISRWAADLSRAFISQGNRLISIHVAGQESVIQTEFFIRDFEVNKDGTEINLVTDQGIEKWVWGRRGQWELKAKKEVPGGFIRVVVAESAPFILARTGRGGWSLLSREDFKPLSPSIFSSFLGTVEDVFIFNRDFVLALDVQGIVHRFPFAQISAS